MKQLKVVWKKELKNCVPFIICVNGQEQCVIKRGEETLLNIGSDNVEVYFVPKAPKWFGWKALKLQVNVLADFAQLELGVEVPNNSLMGRWLPQELRNAANINNQLHCIDAEGLEVTNWEYIKKYR